MCARGVRVSECDASSPKTIIFSIFVFEHTQNWKFRFDAKMQNSTDEMCRTDANASFSDSCVRQVLNKIQNIYMKMRSTSIALIFHATLLRN